MPVLQSTKFALCKGSPTCEICGAPHAEGINQSCPASKSMPKFKVGKNGLFQSPQEIEGWGDKIESMLKEWGITEESYKEFKGQLGLKKICWCPWRKEFLNEFGKTFGRSKAQAVLSLFKRKSKATDGS